MAGRLWLEQARELSHHWLGLALDCLGPVVICTTADGTVWYRGQRYSTDRRFTASARLGRAPECRDVLA